MTTQPTPAAPPSATSFRIAPADLWRMFKERWLIGLLVGVAAAAAILYFDPADAPLYHTEVSLLFSQKKDRVLNIPDVVDTTLQTPVELQTHVEQLRSKAFLEYLLSSFTPEETKRIQAPYLDPDHPNDPAPGLGMIIQPFTTIYVRKGTNIIGIGISNRDPENAALIANRYARKYIDFTLDRANTGTNSAIVFLRNQVDDMRRQVSAAETALQEYRAHHNLASLGETQNVIVEKISSLGSNLVKAQMEQIELKTVLDNIARLEAAHRPLTELPQILGFGQVSQAKNTLETLRGQRALLEERYLAKHPKMKENALQAADAQRQLDEGIARAVAEFRTRHEVAARYEQQLHGEMNVAEAQAHEFDKIAIDYRFLDQDVQTKRAAYARIADRLNEASITSQLENVNMRVFDNAWVANAPTDNRPALTFLLAGGAAFACLVFIPLGLGFFDTRLKTTGHVETVLGEKLLGVLHRIKSNTAAQRAQAFLHDTDGPHIEAYRGLYGEIEVASTLAYPKSLLITSSLPNEGKSLIAGNLASVFSSHGRRTLLVDCDLRRPALHDYFEINGQEGWIQWLQQPAASRPPLPNVVNLAPRLDLLPAGAVPSNCTQLLEQLAGAGIQKQLLAAYDLVIFDTPPATVFPDALLLARSCHEMIYVCLFSSVRLATVKRALAHLRSTGVHILGVVINQMPAAGGTTGFYNYGTKSAKYYQTYKTRTK